MHHPINMVQDFVIYAFNPWLLKGESKNYNIRWKMFMYAHPINMIQDFVIYAFNPWL